MEGCRDRSEWGYKYTGVKKSNQNGSKNTLGLRKHGDYLNLVMEWGLMALSNQLKKEESRCGAERRCGARMGFQKKWSIRNG